MYRVYVIDRQGIYWLREWVRVDGMNHPILSSERKHARRYERFADAMKSMQELRMAGNDAHIDSHV